MGSDNKYVKPLELIEEGLISNNGYDPIHEYRVRSWRGADIDERAINRHSEPRGRRPALADGPCPTFRISTQS